MHTLTRAQILAVPVSEPERLFGKPESMPARFKELAKRWHPDAGGDDEVFAHIALLHTQAKHLLDTDNWQTPGEFSFKSVSGRKYALRYFKSFDFELGKAYLSEKRLTYVIRNEFADLVDHAKRVISGLTFPNNETKEVMSRYLPNIKDTFETADSVIVMMDKPNDLIRMRDLRDHLGGTMEPKHVAWIMSRMLNHASYLEWAKLSHNDFSLDSLFVCPEMHTVCVLGGWWYAAPVGSKLKALPQRTINNAPSDVIAKKVASNSTDAELARLTGRELLGNANGIHLVGKVPEPMLDWLRVSGKGSPIKDYAEWREKILMKSFGPRKFMKLSVTSSEVYPL